MIIKLRKKYNQLIKKLLMKIKDNYGNYEIEKVIE